MFHKIDDKELSSTEGGQSILISGYIKRRKVDVVSQVTRIIVSRTIA